MRKPIRFMTAFVAGCVAAGTVLTTALASSPPPLRPAIQETKAQTVSGRLNVRGVLRVNNNTSVYGRTYSHGGLQVWKGLIVRSGGVTADKLDVVGPMTGLSLSLNGPLTTTGAMTGTSLTLSGALSATGRITGSSIDAGSGGLTTTGAIAGGNLTVASIADSGALTAAGKITGSSLDAGSGGVTTTGPITGGNLTVASIADSGALSAGSISIAGAASLGTLSTGNTVVNGNLSAGGLTVNANTSLANGADLILSVASKNASHLVANGDRDVAGTVSMSIASSNFVAGHETASTWNFASPYSVAPVVVVTPVGDPEPGSGEGAAPKIWVTSTATSFTIHYVPVPATAGTTAPTVTFHYMVMGQ